MGVEENFDDIFDVDPEYDVIADKLSELEKQTKKEKEDEKNADTGGEDDDEVTKDNDDTNDNNGAEEDDNDDFNDGGEHNDENDDNGNDWDNEGFDINRYKEELVSSGIIGEDEDIKSPEEAIELMAYKKFKELTGQLPDKLREINQYVINGGSFEEAVKAVMGIEPKKEADDSVPKEGTDEYYEYVVKEYYKMKDEEDDVIADSIDALKSSGKLEEFAKKVESKVKQYKEKLKKLEIEDLEKKRLAAIKAIEQNVDSFRKDLIKMRKDFDDIDDEDIKTLPDYALRPTVKLPDGKLVTPLQADLRELLKDKRNLLILSRLVKAKFDLKQLDGKTKKKTSKRKAHLGSISLSDLAF